VAPVRLGEEMCDERREIVAARAQWRDLERDHLEPVQQILAKRTVGDARAPLTEQISEAARTRKVGYGASPGVEMGPVISAESQARIVVAEAEERARKVIGEAELRAKSVTEDTERHLREEISRLESIRTQLAGDVETISRHLDGERNRLRSALSDMLSWVDEHVQPASTLLAQRAGSPSRPRDTDDGPTPSLPDTAGGAGGSGGGPAMSLEGAGRGAVPVRGNAATGGAGPISPADARA